jgi:hypothetical protein
MKAHLVSFGVTVAAVVAASFIMGWINKAKA